MTVTDTQPPDRNQAMNAVSRGEISAPDYDELRNEMRRAIEAREKSEIARVFIRATDISAKATGSEARYKKGKDLKKARSVSRDWAARRSLAGPMVG
jgi:hypothetical protein